MRPIAMILITLFAVSPMFSLATATAAEAGTLHVSLISCPPGENPVEGDCTDVLEDDGSATVTLPDGSSSALNAFERDNDGAYIIPTAPGEVTVQGLKSSTRAVMMTDANTYTDDAAMWFVPAGGSVDGQVRYADEEPQGPYPVPLRESGTIILSLLLCEDGYPADGRSGCEAVEDDGRLMFHASGDSVSYLSAFERQPDGAYIVKARVGQLELQMDQLVSENGYDVTYDADHITMDGKAIWNVVQGAEREVNIYYTPPVEQTAGENTGLISTDPNLPPARPESQGMSMGGPEGLGTVNVHVLNCDEGVAPSLEECTETVSSVAEIQVSLTRRAPAPLASFDQNDDGSWAVTGPQGTAVLSGMEPIRTDAAITNGQVIDDATITFDIDSGDVYDLYVIYYFKD